MTVRILVPAALLALGLGRAGIAADAGQPAFAPRSYGIQRYEVIWKRSPFIVETVAVPQSMGLAAKYSLVGIASISNQPVAFLVDNTNLDAGKNRLVVSKGQTSREGIEIVSITMDGDPRKSSITIRQGGQQASLVFAPASLSLLGPGGAPGAVPPSPEPIQPPIAPSPLGVIPSIASPQAGAPTPPPPVRRIVRPVPVTISPN
ncbi:MAG: hypothetical protein PHC88_11320 [Terrimicrobiaceae bacterium]|nr:hypothetical protein [Terrimicrobiaceae bacterium]